MLTCESGSDGLHCVCVAGVAEESLEEISLKLIKSFLQEKTELEDQYAQVMSCSCEMYIRGAEGNLDSWGLLMSILRM
jgi:hypothetical protein